jgi:CDP-diacylglycerol--serine O-phosphatidyltransferase
MIRSFHVADRFTLADAACGSGAVFLSMAYVSESGVAHG